MKWNERNSTLHTMVLSLYQQNYAFVKNIFQYKGFKLELTPKNNKLLLNE